VRATRRRIRIVWPDAGLRGGLLLLACAWAAAPGSGAAESAAAAGGGAAPADWAHVDRRTGEIDALLAAAHFRTALALTEDALVALPAVADHELVVADHELAARRARLEVLRATAEIALGRPADARRSLARALRADPGLVLDERAVSPKVRALLPRARQLAATPEPAP
jgi:hypothetical protein